MTEQAGTHNVDGAARHRDLRDLLTRIDALGELERVQGADWNLEFGAIGEMACRGLHGDAPALLFEDIPGIDPGFRALSGVTNSARRLALILGFPEPETATDIVKSYRDRMRAGFAPVPPVTVTDGPVLENIQRGEDVDLTKFPVPVLHEEDGGRYLGTDDLVIMRDPDTGWINIGCYRIQMHDRNTVGIWISPGKHGRLIRDKYFARGAPCPVVISCGHDPVLSLVANQSIGYGEDEYGYAGGHRAAPIEVIESEIHRLPMPARSEIVIEGAIDPAQTLPEGPFGEFMGYYASDRSEKPIIRVERVYHRNDPILTMSSPSRPPNEVSFGLCLIKSAMIWDEIESAGLPGVAGVWCHEAGAARMFQVVAIDQLYPGHSKQAGMLTQNCSSGNYAARWTIVVDSDIDPASMFDVIWAMSTRCDPAEDIDFIRKGWSTPLDSMIRRPPYQSNRAVVDACRPWNWKDEFPKVTEASPALAQKTREKWGHILKRRQ